MLSIPVFSPLKPFDPDPDHVDFADGRGIETEFAVGIVMHDDVEGFDLFVRVGDEFSLAITQD